MAVSVSDKQAALGVLPQAGLLVSALAVAAALELLILRTGTRTAIHIPGLESLTEPYRVFAWSGRYAYYVAALLLVVTIPVLIRLLWRERGPTGKAGAVALGAFVIAAAAARADFGSVLLLDMTMVVAVAAMALVVAAAGTFRRRVAFVVFAAAFVCAAAFTVTQQAVAFGFLGELDSRWMNRVAEPLLLMFAITLPWTVGAARRRRDWTVGLIAGLVILSVFASQPSTARILLLWNEGLVGAYPSIAYAAAAAGAAIAASSLARSGRLPEAAAIVLLVAGGVGLHSTYQTGLVIVALAVLACGRVDLISPPPVLEEAAS